MNDVVNIIEKELNENSRVIIVNHDENNISKSYLVVWIQSECTQASSSIYCLYFFDDHINISDHYEHHASFSCFYADPEFKLKTLRYLLNNTI